MSAAETLKHTSSSFMLQSQRGQLPPSNPEKAKYLATAPAVETVEPEGLAAERPAQAPAAPGLDASGLAAGDTLLDTGLPVKTPRWKKANYFQTDGILYRQSKDRNQKCLFTEGEKKKAFWEAHVVKRRHYGSRTTHANLRRKYYWPEMATDVQKRIKKCKKCEDKHIRMAAQVALEASSLGGLKEESRTGLQSLVPQEKGLFSFASLHLFGPLELTATGARFAFVAVDYFTQSVHAAPMQTCSPQETGAQILKLVKRFGLPEGIISTQQHSFLHQLNTILKMALKIQRNLVVQYNPQTDCFLENSTSFVRRLLSLVLTANPADWDQHLHKVFFLPNRYPGCEEEVEEEEVEEQEEVEEEQEEVEEEDLSSLKVKLQEASAPAENWPPSICAPEAPGGSADGERESLVKAQSRDTCFYCNRLPDEGDSDVFAVIQCDKCQVWAHDLCVRRKHGYVYQKTLIRCRTCILADVSVGSSRAREAGDGGASSLEH